MKSVILLFFSNKLGRVSIAVPTYYIFIPKLVLIPSLHKILDTGHKAKNNQSKPKIQTYIQLMIK